MIRQNQKTFNAIQRIIDSIGVISTLYLSYLICREFQGFNLIILLGWSSSFIFFALIFIALIHMVFFVIFKIYKGDRNTKFLISFFNIFKANFCLYLLLTFVSLFYSVLIEVQITITIFFLLNTIFQAGYRLVLRLILRWFRKKGYNTKYILILGYNQSTNDFIEKIQNNSKLGYKIIGGLDSVENSFFYLDLQDLVKLKEFLKNNIVDQAVFMQTEQNSKYLKKAMDICEEYSVKFAILPDAFSVFGKRVYISDFDGTPILNMHNVPLESIFNYGIKRTFDIVVSGVCLVLFSPIMSLCAILIKATSKGSIIFCQERVGLSRRVFKMYKFRTMRIDTQGDNRMAVKNDDRCTSVGKYLRRFSLDELPQLLNVLKGDMSLVGPRPEIPHYVEQFREKIPSYMLKHYVKPGMTGWAQVHGLRGDTSISKRIRYDIEYIENWSLFLDLKILFLTLFNGFFNKNAY